MKSNKGTLGHVFNGGSKLMQRLTDQLGRGFQLGMVHRSLLVASVGDLKRHPRLYGGKSKKDGDHDETSQKQLRTGIKVS
jgi:hypothetical protein